MFRSADVVAITVVAIALAPSVFAQDRYAGIGRAATAAELRAWDIDVRPDFKGLPSGSGSVAAGRDIWDAKCASCHGTFGESNEVFTPIVGGTTREDIRTGRVKALLNPEVPRTTLMKLAYISTLWDYINRAMPWNAPKTLTADEVYAVTAYILNLGDIVPDDFVLSDKNIGEVQKTLPNRNGLTREHGLWSVRGKPDVASVACMTDCVADARITSSLPERARDAHGNLAEQNRTFGPVRGIQTIQVAQAAPVQKHSTTMSGRSLATQAGCLVCHGVASKLVGPGFIEIATRYKGESDAQARLVAKVKTGGSGVWGPVSMPPQGQVGDDEIRAMVAWILKGAQ